MGAEEFTGRAQAYTEARPGYPDEAMEYIRNLTPPDAVFADVGAGTGKFTALLARYEYKIYAVEPNADMREQLKTNLAPFPKVKIINGTAEATTLPDRCVDVITCAQALNWFDIAVFQAECRRIGKHGVFVISLYNYNPAEDHGSPSRYDKSTGALYKNPVVREFSNTIHYTRDKWLSYLSSMAGVPQPTDPGHGAYFVEMNEKFDRENVDGVLHLDLMTKVYSERIV